MPPCLLLTATKKIGRPRKVTPGLEEWILRDIDSWKGKLLSMGIPCTDSDALRLSIASSRFNGRWVQSPSEDAALFEEWAASIKRVRRIAEARGNPTPTVRDAVFRNARKRLLDENLAAGIPGGEALKLARAEAQVLIESAYRSARPLLSRLRRRSSNQRP
jgi:hypothetical protein